MQLIPGFNRSPAAPAPLPALPTPDDPEIAVSREKQRKAELVRKGRSSTILTKGLEDNLGMVTRPEAKATKFGE